MTRKLAAMMGISTKTKNSLHGKRRHRASQFDFFTTARWVMGCVFLLACQPDLKAEIATQTNALTTAWENSLLEAHGLQAAGAEEVFDFELPVFEGPTSPLRLVRNRASAEDSEVGLGWRLEGISTIEREGLEEATPTYRWSDRFFLDGKELIPCPENASTPHGSCQQGGTHYTVQAPHIATIEFRRKIRGSDDPSRQADAWYITQADGAKLRYEAYQHVMPDDCADVCGYSAPSFSGSIACVDNRDWWGSIVKPIAGVSGNGSTLSAKCTGFKSREVISVQGGVTASGALFHPYDDNSVITSVQSAEHALWSHEESSLLFQGAFVFGGGAFKRPGEYGDSPDPVTRVEGVGNQLIFHSEKNEVAVTFTTDVVCPRSCEKEPTPYRWHITEARATTGHRVEYAYTCDGNAHCYPTEILHDDAPVVTFEWEDRPDLPIYPTGGDPSGQFRSRLARVLVNTYPYQLHYQEQPGRLNTYLVGIEMGETYSSDPNDDSNAGNGSVSDNLEDGGADPDEGIPTDPEHYVSPEDFVTDPVEEPSSNFLQDFGLDAKPVQEVPGSIAMNHEVTAGGQLALTVPITVPPGTGDLVPNLALRYQSDGGHGVMGLGWSISGLASIERCGATVVHDEFTEGVNFDEDDRFCLNGQRLVLLGEGVYGKSGTEYRTEIESFQRVIAHGQAGVGPAYFVVHTADEQTLEFGVTADARVEAEGKASVLRWALNRIQDRFGNYWTVHYHEEPGEHYPLAIEYGGNAAIGKTPTKAYNRIEFQYEARPDFRTAYRAGSRSQHSVRLRHIVTYAQPLEDGTNAVPVLNYRLRYDEYPHDATLYAISMSRLTSLLLVNAEGEAFRPLRFDWQEPTPGWAEDSGEEGEAAAWHAPIDFVNAEGNHRGVEILDINGDGRMDILWSSGLEDTTDKGAFIGTRNGWVSAPEWTPPWPLSDTTYGPTGAKLVDVTMDGRPDFLAHIHEGWPRDDKHDFRIQRTVNSLSLVNTGLGWSTAPQYALPVYSGFKGLEHDIDANNFRARDIFHFFTELEGNAFRHGPGDVRPRFVDLNGDGRLDMIVSFRNDRAGGDPYKTGYKGGLNLQDGRYFDRETGELAEAKDIQPGEPHGPIIGGAYLNTEDGWVHHEGYSRFLSLTDRPMTRLDEYHTRVFDEGVRFFDVNGDNRPDWVRAAIIARRGKWIVDDCPYDCGMEGGWFDNEELVRREVFLNTGNGWEVGPDHLIPPKNFLYTTEWMPSTYRFIDHNEGVAMADINGDGLLDQLVALEGFDRKYRQQGPKKEWAAYLNTGNGWIEAPEYTPPVPLGATKYNDDKNGHRFFTSVDAGTRLIDLDGNGLVDLLCDREDTGRGVFLNTGNGWSSKLAESWLPPVPVASKGGKDLGVRFADIRGIGFSDLLYRRPGERPRTWFSRGRPHRVGRFSDGLNSTSITYAPLSNEDVYTKSEDAAYPNVDVQIPTHVVSTLQTEDGLGGQRVHRYRYGGLKVNVHGRGSLGLAWQEMTDEGTGVKTHTEFRQDFPYIGLVDNTEERDAQGNLLYRQTNVLDQEVLSHGRRLVRVASVLEETYPLHDTVMTEDLIPIKTEEVTTQYNAFNQPKEIFHVVQSGDQRERFTTRTVHTYKDAVDAASHPKDWRLPRLSNSKVTRDNGDKPLTRETAYDYVDGPSRLVEEILEPNTPLRFIQRYAYDRFGHRTRTTVRGPEIAGVSPEEAVGIPQSEARETSIQYDQRGRFVVWRKNALGQKTHLRTDYRFGGLLERINPAGLTTSQSYDGFGRLVQETNPDGTFRRTIHEWADPIWVQGRKAVIRTTIASESAAPERVYVDALGLEIRRERVGLHGRRIFVDTAYNPRGLAVRVSEPYFSGDRAHFSESKFDLRAQLIELLPADGSPARTWSYDGLVVTQKDGKGRETVTTQDVLGRTVRVEDALDGYLEFEYNALGHRVQTIDSEENKTVVTTDLRGRKTAVRDPDLGAWSYHYNPFDELVWTKDAKGNIRTDAYDALGRLVKRSDAEGTYLWVYDEVDGFLRTVTGPGGYERAHTYDEFGRPTTTQIKVQDSAGVEQTLSTTIVYDPLGRASIVTYPQGVAVQRVYCDFGHLVRLDAPATNQPYWRLEAMNARGQIIRARLGGDALDPNSGTLSTRVHDPANGHLKEILDTRGQTVLQQVSYDFDEVGNLRERFDALHSFREIFEYDPLDRLEIVTDSHNRKKQFGYNALGNIRFKKRWHADGSVASESTYHYEGTQPHAVTRVTKDGIDETYEYDANGNMDRRRGSPIGYTSANLVQQIAGAHPILFRYNPEGRRYLKQSPTHELVYLSVPGAQYEREVGNKDTRHRYTLSVSGESVAIIERTNNTQETRYLHRDHLGSVTVVSSSEGVPLEELRYDAWGKRRLLEGEDPSTSVLRSSWSRRGYTQHEHLDEVGLIHMNGRVYDPDLGRFVSPDPFVQFPDNLQSYNRYAYVLNNPLRYTDPSGFFLEKVLEGFGRAFMGLFHPMNQWAIVGAVVGQPYGLAWQAGLGATSGAAIGTLNSGGNFQDFIVQAGFSGATFFLSGGLLAKPLQSLGFNFLASHILSAVAVGSILDPIRAAVFGDDVGKGFLNRLGGHILTGVVNAGLSSGKKGAKKKASAGGQGSSTSRSDLVMSKAERAIFKDEIDQQINLMHDILSEIVWAKSLRRIFGFGNVIDWLRWLPWRTTVNPDGVEQFVTVRELSYEILVQGLLSGLSNSEATARVDRLIDTYYQDNPYIPTLRDTPAPRGPVFPKK